MTVEPYECFPISSLQHRFCLMRGQLQCKDVLAVVIVKLFLHDRHEKRKVFYRILIFEVDHLIVGEETNMMMV